MTVAGNIGFGLKTAPPAARTDRRQVGEGLNWLASPGWAQGAPIQLFGGQQQRVASPARWCWSRRSCSLGRSPIASLDQALRELLRRSPASCRTSSGIKMTSSPTAKDRRARRPGSWRCATGQSQVTVRDLLPQPETPSRGFIGQMNMMPVEYLRRADHPIRPLSATARPPRSPHFGRAPRRSGCMWAMAGAGYADHRFRKPCRGVEIDLPTA